MRRQLLTALFAIVAAALAASVAVAEIPWRSDYGAALREAEASKRPLLVYVQTADCVYCRRLEKQTFADPAIEKLLRGFVTMKMDAATSGWFVRKMGIKGYPALVASRPDGTLRWIHSGFRGPGQLAQELGGVPPGPAPAEEAEEELTELPIQNFGINLDSLGLGPEHRLIHGMHEHAVTRAEAFELLANNGLPDDAKKARLTIIGSDADRKPVEDELAKPANADLRDKSILWSVRPDHWSVRNSGWVLTGKPSVYMQAPKGSTIQVPVTVDGKTKWQDAVAQGDEVLHRQDDFKPGDFQAIRKAMPDYDPAKDPDRRKPKVAKLQVIADGKTRGAAGELLRFRIRALDADGNPVAGYKGPVKLSTTSPSTELPAELQLVDGAGAFAAKFAIAGDHQITATDAAAPDVTGSSDLITITLLTIANIPPQVLTLVALAIIGAVVAVRTSRK